MASIKLFKKNIDEDVIHSIIASSTRIISGPLTLIFIARQLSLAEQGYYYLFFSIQAASQIVEAGIGFVIMQYIAHKMSNASFKNGKLHADNKTKLYIYDKFIYMTIWYLAASIIIFIPIYFSANFIFTDPSTNIDWKVPWATFILTSALIFITTPLSHLTEGLQNQKKVFRTRTIASIFGSTTLWISLSNNLGLYSIALSQASVAIVNLISYIPATRYLILDAVKNRLTSLAELIKILKTTSVEIWPFFSKMAIIWISGYFFWNSMNIAAFKFGGAEYAGQLAMSLAVFKAISTICESIVSSKQATFGKLLGQEQNRSAVDLFNKLCTGAVLIYVISTILALASHPWWPTFISTKTLNLTSLLILAVAYLAQLIMLNMSLFMRCTKKEPMFYNSLFQNIALPVGVFFISSLISPRKIPELFMLIMIFACAWCITIYKNFKKTEI